jgi:hypothetical protein
MNNEEKFLKFSDRKELEKYYITYFTHFNLVYFSISPDKINYSESIVFDGNEEKAIQEIQKLMGENE